MPTTPSEFRLLTWFPAIPTKIFLIFSSIKDWACSTAFSIASVVASILTTTPFLRPLDGYVPNESISRLSDESYLPTKQTTFEVPMSKPTIRSLFFDWLFVIFQRNSCITS